MKKLLVLFALLLVAVVGVMPAAAVPVEDLTGLAAYYPADTAAFFALRTDAAYIETIDALIGRVVSAIPGAPPVSLTAELDRLSQAASSGSFAEVFGPWLGDTAAFGVINLALTSDSDSDNDNDALLLTVEITDRAAAVEYLTTVGEEDYEITEGADYTVFTPISLGAISNDAPPIAIGDDVLFLGAVATAMAGMPDPALSGADAFGSALASLPETDYNVIGFINVPEIMGFAFEQMPADSPEMASMATLEAVGPVALGFTLLDSRSLTMDITAAVDIDALGAMTGVSMPEMNPIDMSFVDQIPAGTPIVAISSNIQGTYENLLLSLRSAAEMQGEEDAQEQIDEALQQVNFAVRGLTGLDLEEDVLSWMTGEYALYLGLTPAVAEADNLFAALADGLPVNFGLLIDASANPDAAAEVVEGIAQAVDFASAQAGETTEIDVTNETMGGSDALVITITDRSLPFPIELLIASNDEVFIFGTRGAVQAAMAPDGGLSSDPAFQEAMTYALPNTNAFLYLAGEGLMPLANLVASAGGQEAEMQAEILESVLGLLSSSSISGAMTEDGTQVQRWVLTLPE